MSENSLVDRVEVVEAPHEPVTILFLIKHLDFGGGEYVFRTIIERLDRAKFRPILVCLTREGAFGRQLRDQGVPVYAGLLKHKLDLRVLLRLRQIIARERAAMIYLSDYRDAMLWGALAGRFNGIKTILATHSTDWWGRRYAPTLIGKKFLPWHHRIVVIAAFQKAHLIAQEGVPEALIEVIPNGIDFRHYGVAKAEAPRHAAIGFPEEAFVVGTVAVLRQEKNIDMLFVAVARLAAAGIDARAAIIGDGDQRAALEKSAAAMGLASRVKFLGYRDDPGAILPSLDVFTLTSRIEVMPITILEAMACALPVVATKVGAVPEIVAEGETGYTIASGDVSALAQRLADLAGAPALRQQLGQKGRERVRALFTLDAMIGRTEALLEATARHRV